MTTLDRRSGHAVGEHRFVFDEQGIKSSGPGYEGVHKWDIVKRIERVNGMILIFVLRGHVPTINLLIWLAGAGLVSASRLVVHGLYRKSATKKSHPQKWNAWFIITLCLSGVLWGSTAIFLFPSDSIGHQAFIAFVAGGMVAGAIGAFSAVLPAFYLFSIPALLPLCFRFFMLGSNVHIAMGTMVILFLLINIFTANRMHKDILSLLALRYEKSALITGLQQEVEQRKTAQKDLRRQKEQVEAIVTQRTAELRDANQRLQAIITYAPLLIWAMDRKGILTVSDGKGMEKIGLTPGRPVGKSVFDLFADNKPQCNADGYRSKHLVQRHAIKSDAGVDECKKWQYHIGYAAVQIVFHGMQG